MHATQTDRIGSVPVIETRTGGRRIRGLDAAQRRAQRRDQLLEAALELFATQGYANTSIEQICQTAYVGTKGFYELFANKEACYLALLDRITQDISQRLVEGLRDAPADEQQAARQLIAGFAHAVVDDPRRAQAAFGEGAGVSPNVDHQRRVNRRWGAEFIQSVWRRYGVDEHTVRPGVDLHRVAVGLIGGLFDLIVDWLHDAGPGHAGDVEALISDLTTFYELVRSGLGGEP